jgi:hypothetical protein
MSAILTEVFMSRSPLPAVTPGITLQLSPTPSFRILPKSSFMLSCHLRMFMIHTAAMLQAGRSRVRISMRSLELLSIYLILPALRLIQPVPGILLGSRARRVHEADNLTSMYARMSRLCKKVGSSTCTNPVVQHGLAYWNNPE